LLIEPYLVERADHIPGLYAFLRSTEDRALARRLSHEWLERYADLPAGSELELIDSADCLIQAGPLSTLASARLDHLPAPSDRRLHWQAVAFLADLDAFLASHGGGASPPPEMLWALRHRLGDERGSSALPAPAAVPQLGWIVRSYRSIYPYATHPNGSWSGNCNAWDATDFIRSVIGRLAADDTDAATAELAALARVSHPKQEHRASESEKVVLRQRL
jgi:hypothetical protein